MEAPGYQDTRLSPPGPGPWLTWKYWFSCTRLSLDRILLMVIRLLLIPPKPEEGQRVTAKALDASLGALSEPTLDWNGDREPRTG